MSVLILSQPFLTFNQNVITHELPRLINPYSAKDHSPFQHHHHGLGYLRLGSRNNNVTKLT